MFIQSVTSLFIISKIESEKGKYNRFLFKKYVVLEDSDLILFIYLKDD